MTPLKIAPFLDIDDKLSAIDGNVPFYYHFGQFMALFAVMEGQFHAFFQVHSGLELNVAKAIMGGEPFKKLTSVCNRMIQGKTWGKDRKEEFQEIVDQVNAIADFRNALVHRGVESIAEEIVSSNALVAKTHEGVEILRFNIGHIKSARADVLRIILLLVTVVSPDVRRQLEASIQQILERPWQYKRLVPDKPNQRQ